jgi:hypothetical protein
MLALEDEYTTLASGGEWSNAVGLSSHPMSEGVDTGQETNVPLTIRLSTISVSVKSRV